MSDIPLSFCYVLYGATLRPHKVNRRDAWHAAWNRRLKKLFVKLMIAVLLCWKFICAGHNDVLQNVTKRNKFTF